MLTASQGLHLNMGRYSSYADQNDLDGHEVTVRGQSINTRTAMTWELYCAFIEQANAAGVNPLPDSEPDVITQVFGEHVFGHYTLTYATVYNDKPIHGYDEGLGFFGHSLWKLALARPAVELSVVR